MPVDQAGQPDTIHTSLASCRPSEAHSAVRRQAFPCSFPHIGHRHGGERWPTSCGCFFVPVSPRPTFSSNQHGQSVTNPTSPNQIRPDQTRPDLSVCVFGPGRWKGTHVRCTQPPACCHCPYRCCSSFFPFSSSPQLYHERQSEFNFLSQLEVHNLGAHALRPALLPPAPAPHRTTPHRPDQTRPRDSNITPH